MGGSSTHDAEGFVTVPGGRVWYRIVGADGGLPLLTLHGGPGYPHDYLEPLAGLADDRPVIFYDQLGCGRSERPDDPPLWNRERFVAELASVRAALDLDRFHLLGHSWGSMLAVDYALTNPAGLASLVLVSPPLSIPRWLADAAVLRRGLPANVRAALDRHEAAGTTDTAEYAAATEAYYRRHLCLIDPWPEPVTRSFAGVGRPVNLAMWGPSGCHVTGSLRDYDRSDQLGDLDLPVLFACGQYDEATPETTAWYRRLVPGAELAVFAGSSHMPMVEESGVFIATVRDFLDRVESWWQSPASSERAQHVPPGQDLNERRRGAL